MTVGSWGRLSAAPGRVVERRVAGAGGVGFQEGGPLFRTVVLQASCHVLSRMPFPNRFSMAGSITEP